MAGYKKKIVCPKTPKEKEVSRRENPNSYLQMYPSWRFSDCDSERWRFDQGNLSECFWEEVFPFLQSLEKQKWSEILVGSEKKNHSIKVKDLNTVARKRLESRQIEADALVSIRLQGKHRLYGLLFDGVFRVLWFDRDHGDNPDCVCRSSKDHT